MKLELDSSCRSCDNRRRFPSLADGSSHHRSFLRVTNASLDQIISLVPFYIVSAHPLLEARCMTHTVNNFHVPNNGHDTVSVPELVTKIHRRAKLDWDDAKPGMWHIRVMPAGAKVCMTMIVICTIVCT